MSSAPRIFLLSEYPRLKCYAFSDSRENDERGRPDTQGLPLPLTNRRATTADFTVAVTIEAVHIAIRIGAAVKVTETAVSAI